MPYNLDRKTADGIQRALAELKADACRELIEALVKVPPSETTHLTFALIGDVPIKIAVRATCQLLGGAAVGVLTEAASEADLLEAMELTKDYEMRVRLRTLLNLIRENADKREPLEIKIVNAGELAPATKVAAVKRGDDGKISGLVVESVPSPD